MMLNMHNFPICKSLSSNQWIPHNSLFIHLYILFPQYFQFFQISSTLHQEGMLYSTCRQLLLQVHECSLIRLISVAWTMRTQYSIIYLNTFKRSLVGCSIINFSKTSIGQLCNTIAHFSASNSRSMSKD